MVFFKRKQTFLLGILLGLLLSLGVLFGGVLTGLVTEQQETIAFTENLSSFAITGIYEGEEPIQVLLIDAQEQEFLIHEIPRVTEELHAYTFSNACTQTCTLTGTAPYTLLTRPETTQLRIIAIQTTTGEIQLTNQEAPQEDALFAELDEEGVVLRVLVVPAQQAHRGEEFLRDDLNLGGRWVQTSTDASIRGMYAGIGSIYREDLDEFIPAKPHASWVFNEEERAWNAPVQRPGENFFWDEQRGRWMPLASQ